MLKKTEKDDHDAKSRYISTIVSLTRQQLEIAKLNDSYEEINAYFNAIRNDELAIKKYNIREQKKMIQQEKQEMQNQIDREVEEEKSVRRQAKEMKGSHEMRL